MAITVITDTELSGNKRYTLFRCTDTGTSEPINVADLLLSLFSMQCEVPNGTLTTITGFLEGSVSGNSWDTVLTLSNVADLGKIIANNPSPVAYYRIRISVLSLGTAPYVDVHILGVG